MNDLPARKSALTEAFAALRRTGFVARQSYLCCRSCAGAALDTPENRGKPVVYFTRQDKASFDETGQVYLAYGVIGDDADEAYEAVGDRIVQALLDQGLTVEWSGSAFNRILVTGMAPAEKVPEPEATYLDLVGETDMDVYSEMIHFGV